MIITIDGFQINSSTPIDNRMVAHGLTARNDIEYKYDGLRVFDTLESIPYVWMNGSWVNENSFSVGVSGSSDNYIPVFKPNNLIGNSILYQINNRIGLNTIEPTDMFEIKNGNISIVGNGYFKGDGQGLEKLNADEIKSGLLELSRLTNGTNGYVLCASTPEPKYVNPSLISVGTSSFSTSTDSIKLSTGTASSLNYIPFSPTIGAGSQLKHDTKLKYDSINQTLNVGSIKLDNTVSGLTSSASKSTHGSFYKSSSGLFGTFSLGSIRVDSNVAFSLSATFVTSMKPLTSPTSLTQSYHTNTFEGFYMVGGSTSSYTNITEISKTTIFSSGWTYSTAYAYDGYITTSNNQIDFIASFSGSGTCKCTVYYKIVVV